MFVTKNRHIAKKIKNAIIKSTKYNALRAGIGFQTDTSSQEVFLFYITKHL